LLIQKDPVAKKKKASKRPAAAVAATDATANNSNKKSAKAGLKVGRGKSGVEFRYHVPKEYATLSQEQKKELKKWRDEMKAGSKAKASAVSIRTEIAAVLKEERAKEEKKQKEVSEVKAILSTLLASAAGGAPPRTASADVSSTNASGKVKVADTGAGSPQNIDPAQAEIAAMKLQALFDKKSTGGRKSAKKSGGH
jgi:hypothetical protein